MGAFPRAPMSDEVDLDALLESALEDFSNEPEAVQPPPPTRSPAAPTPSNQGRESEPDLANLMDNPMKALSDLLSNPQMRAEFESDFQNMMKEMGEEGPEGFSLDTLQKELSSLSTAMNEEQVRPTPSSSSPATATPPVPPASESKREAPATGAPSGESAEDLEATLRNMMNSAKNLQDSEGGMPFGEESLMEMFKEIESNPELSDMMEG